MYIKLPELLCFSGSFLAFSVLFVELTTSKFIFN